MITKKWPQNLGLGGMEFEKRYNKEIRFFIAY
ncbi:hypothetical protein SPPR111872_12825 [Sphingobacterium prati]